VSKRFEKLELRRLLDRREELDRIVNLEDGRKRMINLKKETDKRGFYRRLEKCLNLELNLPFSFLVIHLNPQLSEYSKNSPGSCLTLHSFPDPSQVPFSTLGSFFKPWLPFSLSFNSIKPLPFSLNFPFPLAFHLEVSSSLMVPVETS